MNRSRHRAAIVGCGRIAGALDRPRVDGPVTTHAQAYSRHEAFDLVAACDTDSHKLDEFQGRWSIPQAHLNVASLVDECRPDVVSVCSPTGTHHDVLREILGRPSPPRVVFVEKPATTTAIELASVEALASESGVSVLVNHTRRFDPMHRHVRDLVRSGAFGALVAGRCAYYGGWMNNGSHTIDTLRMLLGGTPAIAAVAHRPGGRGDDPALDVRLDWGGAPVEIATVDERHYQLWEIELRFVDGRVTFRDFGREVRIERAAVNDAGERVLLSADGGSTSALDAPVHHAVEAIARCLDGVEDLSHTGSLLAGAAVTMRLGWDVMACGAATVRER